MYPVYDENKGQYVLQIRTINKTWEDMIVLKSQNDLNVAIRRAKCCKDSGDRAGVLRVVHKFMGINVIADYT
jgi:hypothetical protein